MIVILTCKCHKNQMYYVNDERLNGVRLGEYIGGGFGDYLVINNYNSKNHAISWDGYYYLHNDGSYFEIKNISDLLIALTR